MLSVRDDANVLIVVHRAGGLHFPQSYGIVDGYAGGDRSHVTPLKIRTTYRVLDKVTGRFKALWCGKFFFPPSRNQRSVTSKLNNYSIDSFKDNNPFFLKKVVEPVLASIAQFGRASDGRWFEPSLRQCVTPLFFK